MSAPLKRLIYYSRSTMPGGPAEIAAGVEQILSAALRYNPSVGVTGALLFNSGCFAQVLEGPSAGIGEVFERVQRDPRHAAVVALEFREVAARGFPQWSMACVGGDRTDLARFAEVARRSELDPARLSGAEIFTTLQRLLREEDGAVATR